MACFLEDLSIHEHGFTFSSPWLALKNPSQVIFYPKMYHEVIWSNFSSMVISSSQGCSHVPLKHVNGNYSSCRSNFEEKIKRSRDELMTLLLKIHLDFLLLGNVLVLKVELERFKWDRGSRLKRRWEFTIHS